MMPVCLTLVALAVAPAAVAATPAESYEVRMQIIDRAGKTLAKPRITVLHNVEGTVSLRVSGWNTSVSAILRPGARSDCHVVRVSMTERKTYPKGLVGKRDAKTTAEVCGADSLTLGDERARRLVLSVRRAAANP